MDDKTELIRQNIHETRESLTEKIESLEEQVVNPVQGTTDTVTDAVQAVPDTVTQVKADVQGSQEALSHARTQLGTDEVAGVHEHLEGCGKCRRLVAEAAQLMFEDGQGGQATATAPNPRVLLSGQPSVLLSAPWVVAGCPLVPPPLPPCVTGQWILGTLRVISNGQPGWLSCPHVGPAVGFRSAHACLVIRIMALPHRHMRSPFGSDAPLLVYRCCRRFSASCPQLRHDPLC